MRSKELKPCHVFSYSHMTECYLVFRIADEIMADCMRDVSEELMEINSDVVEHVYKSEFKETAFTAPEQKA